MTMWKYSSLMLALALLPASMVPAAAQRVKAGTLVCNIAPSVGMIVGSRQDLSCRFTPAGRRGPVESYRGQMTRIGLDLGFTRGGRLVWGVFAPSRSLRRGALAGNYVGASGDAAFGIGLGANVLVGGSNRSVALQPVSVEGTRGVSVGAGLADLRLWPGR